MANWQSAFRCCRAIRTLAGTIFGGVILAHLDQAGGIEARKQADKLFVTVAMRGIEFIAPVFVGDLVSFYTWTLKVGTTTMPTVITAATKSYA